MLYRIFIKLLILFNVSLSFSCAKKNIIYQSNLQDIHFKIAFEQKNNKDYIKFHFKSIKDTSFTWDWKAVDYECYNHDSHDLLLKKTNSVAVILNSIKFNQLILEDKLGNKRFYSSFVLFKGEEKEIGLKNCMSDWNDKIELIKGKETILENEIKYHSDFLPAENSKWLRIHYLFKPQNYIRKDYPQQSIIITSDWVKYPYKF